MLLYAITDRRSLDDSEAGRTQKLVGLAARWAAQGIDFVQVREKDLSPAALAELTAQIVDAVRQNGAATKVLINAGPETAVAIAGQTHADGVHLASGLSDRQLAVAVGGIRRWLGHGAPVSVSCHSTADVLAARAAAASLALFAPVFEKVLPGIEAAPGRGLQALAEACRAAREARSELPVLALGGVTLENAAQCIAVGASGIAAIRLFADRGWLSSDAARQFMKAERSAQAAGDNLEQ